MQRFLCSPRNSYTLYGIWGNVNQSLGSAVLAMFFQSSLSHTYSQLTIITIITNVLNRCSAISLLSNVLTQPLTGKNKPIKCRKVTFSDVISTQAISMLNPGSVKPHRRTCNIHKNDLRRNTKKPSPEAARFFDFADECEKEAFFRRLKFTYTFQLPAKLVN